MAAWAVLVALVAALPTGATANAQASETVLYLDTTSGSPGEMVTSQILVRVGTDDLTSFVIEVGYDPALLSPLGIQISPGWEPGTPTTRPGSTAVSLSGERASSACRRGAACLLGTVSWRVVGHRDALVTVVRAELKGDDGNNLEVKTAAGTVLVTDPAAASLEGSTDNVGAGNSIIGAVLLLLLASAIAAPLIAWLLRRRRPRAGHTDPGLAETLGETVAGYLASFESAGQIGEPLDLIGEQAAFQRAAGSRSGGSGAPAPMLRGAASKGSRE